MAENAVSVALIGATSVVGPYVLKRLLSRGHRVAVLARPEAMDLHRYPEHVGLIEGGPEDPGAAAKVVDGARVVYYMAGLTAFPGSQPVSPADADPRGLRAVARACVETGARLVYLSTVTVYRPAPFPFMWPIREDAPRRAHGNESMKLYGESRIKAEDLLRGQHEKHGLEFVVLRPASVFAPGVPFVEHLLQESVLRPRQALVRGARLGTMQWVHAEDLADATLRAGIRRGAANRIMNVAGRENVTMADVVRATWELLGAPPEAVPDGARGARGDGGWPPSRFDTRRAKRHLGFTPRVELRDGLAPILSEMEDNGMFDPPRSWPGALRPRFSPS